MTFGYMFGQTLGDRFKQSLGRSCSRAAGGPDLWLHVQPELGGFDVVLKGGTLTSSNEAVAQQLLDNGADVADTDHDGVTPLRAAAAGAHEAVAKQ